MEVILGIVVLIAMIVLGVSIPFAFGTAMVYYYFILGAVSMISTKNTL